MTRSCFGGTCSSENYQRWVDVNGGCLSLTNISITAILPLLTVTQCPICGHERHTLSIHQTSEDMRHPGRRIHHRIKFLTTDYTACIVNNALLQGGYVFSSVCLFFSLLFGFLYNNSKSYWERFCWDLDKENDTRIRVFDIFWSSGPMSDRGMFEFEPYIQPYMGKILVVYRCQTLYSTGSWPTCM